MILTIAKREIQENLYSYKFIIISLLTAVIMSASIFIMYNDYTDRFENYEYLKSRARAQDVLLPPAPLSIYAKGADEIIGRRFMFSQSSVYASASEKSGNNIFLLFDVPDLHYVIKVVLSLCAIMFSFSMITGEKEKKTLSLSCSNSFKRAELIIGKWIGGFITLCIPFCLTFIICAITVGLSSQVQINSEYCIQSGIFLFFSVVYLGIFFSLGLLISCLTNRNVTALVLSLYCWILLVFAIPNIGNIIARQLIEIPTQERLIVERETAGGMGTFLEFNASVAKREDATKKRNEYWAEYEKLVEDYRNRLHRLVTLTQNLTRISPSASFSYVITTIAGTGIADEYRLKQTLLSYRNTYSNPSGGDTEIFRRSSVAELLSADSLIDIMILILYNIVFFTAAFTAFLRYDVR